MSTVISPDVIPVGFEPLWKSETPYDYSGPQCTRIRCTGCGEEYEYMGAGRESADAVRDAEDDGWWVNDDYFLNAKIIEGCCPDCMEN